MCIRDRLNEAQKMYSHAASFTQPTDREGCYYDPDDLYVNDFAIETFSYYGTYSPQNWGDISPHMPGLELHGSEFAFRALGSTKKTIPTLKQRLLKKRKEASATQLREYKDQFAKAKADECKSWVDHDVYEMIDLRKHQCKNFVTGRWVLTIKYDKNNNFDKCKARWVLRGFQDKQKDFQQTDSPTATRPGFRLTCQYAANNNTDLMHVDLKLSLIHI